MKKLLSATAGSTLMLTLLAGCASSETNNTTLPPAPPTSTEENLPTASSEAESITVTHSHGETVVPRNPERTVVFDLGILDTIDALEAETALAIPGDTLPSYLSKYETAVNAGGIKEPDMEAIYTFAPDVIFISARQEDYYDELNEIAPTVYVDLNAETYMDDLGKNTEYLGEIFGKQKQAQSLMDNLLEQVANGQKLAEASDKKALMILTNDGSISAYGKGSRFGIVHDVLGVKTADDEIQVSTHGQEASYEYISQINPDILFVIDRTSIVGGSTAASSTLDNDLIKTTTAFKNDKIVYLDAEIWYLANGGITAASKMIDEIIAAL